MAQSVQISCIVKDDRYSKYDAIQSVGGLNGDGSRWKMSREAAITSIQNGTYAFFTRSPSGHSVNVIVATRNGSKYLKTEADHDTPDNLLSLPTCPA